MSFTQKDIDKFWMLEYEEFSYFNLRYGINLGLTEVGDFLKFIIENPLLAFKHSAGQKIYQVLKSHFDKEDFIKLEKGEILYRGRNRKIDAPKLSAEQLWNPPKGNSSHGRYNLIGTSVLYCTDKVEGIPLEIHAGHDDAIDISIFQNKKEFNLLNMDLFQDFSGFFSQKTLDAKTLKETYLLPNFIRDCCSEIGYYGVKYKGIHDRNRYVNYAFFNFSKDDFGVIRVYSRKFKIDYVDSEK